MAILVGCARLGPRADGAARRMGANAIGWGAGRHGRPGRVLGSYRSCVLVEAIAPEWGASSDRRTEPHEVHDADPRGGSRVRSAFLAARPDSLARLSFPVGQTRGQGQVRFRFLSAMLLVATGSWSDQTRTRSSRFNRRGGLIGSGSPKRCRASGELGGGAAPGTRSQLSSLASRSLCTALRAPWLSGGSEVTSTWCAMQTFSGSSVTARWRSSACRGTVHHSSIRMGTRWADTPMQPAGPKRPAADRQRRLPCSCAP